ncbi:MAG: hypothetical protein QXT26_06710 [Thermoproteota archaeon]
MKIVSAIKKKFPEIDMDAGTFVHALFGFLGVILGRALKQLPFVVSLFSILFVLKQLLDVYGGEVPKVTGGDIAEYSTGLIVGLIIIVLLDAVC